MRANKMKMRYRFTIVLSPFPTSKTPHVRLELWLEKQRAGRIIVPTPEFSLTW
jgi:hypothetical protein